MEILILAQSEFKVLVMHHTSPVSSSNFVFQFSFHVGRPCVVTVLKTRKLQGFGRGLERGGDTGIKYFVRPVWGERHNEM